MPVMKLKKRYDMNVEPKQRLDFYLAKLAGEKVDTDTLMPKSPINSVERALSKISDRIDGIEEKISAPDNDVVFIDYDGKFVASYSAEEFAELDAMPDNPSHEGLIAQGWNWELEDAKEYVAKYGFLDIGQMYTTESGATEIDVELTEGFTSTRLYIAPNGTASIDWGDGSDTDTVTGSSLTTNIGTVHEYAETGKYTIKISVTSGNFAFYNTETQTVLGCEDDTKNVLDQLTFAHVVKSVRVGNGVTLGDYSFWFLTQMEYITIPSGTGVNSNSFQGCYSLKHVTLPSGVTNICDYLFYLCVSLKSVSIPKSATSIGAHSFNYCMVLRRMVVPEGATEIPGGCFRTCQNSRRLAIPPGVTSLGAEAIYSNYTLESLDLPDGLLTIGDRALAACTCSPLIIPASVTNIAARAFDGSGFSIIKFEGTTPPVVANKNAFRYIPASCVIYVPRGYLSAYTSASNYPSSSTYTYVEYDP